MSYAVLNHHAGSHDPWPAIPEDRGIDPYRHVLVVDTIARIGLADPVIVDVGCGDGVTLGLLEGAGYTRLYGIDHSREGLDRAQRRAPAARLIRADLTEPLDVAPPEADIVVCTEVLEHLPADEDVETVMRLVADLARPGGYVIVSVPDDSICEVDPDHRRLFTRADASALLTNAGLIDVAEVEYRYSDEYPWPWMTTVGRKP